MIGKRVRVHISILSVFIFSFAVLPFTHIAASNSIHKQSFILSNLLLHPEIPISREIKINLSFNRNDLHFQSTDQGMLMSLKNCENLNWQDLPALPCLLKTISIGTDESIARIETIKADTIDIPFPDVPLKLAEPPHPISNQSNFLNRITIPALFPPNNFEYVLTENSKTKSLSLQINPIYLFQKKLMLAVNLQIKVSIGIYKTFKKTSYESTKPQSIILSPDELKESAQALQLIHQKDGYDAKVTLLSEIASIPEAAQPQFDGVIGYLDASPDLRSGISAYDNSMARKIQQYVKDLTDQGKIQYLTIMGDATYVPPSYYVYSIDNMSSYDRWVPTDILYGAPKASGKDFPLVVSVGRLPVRDIDEAKQMVSKIDRYRKNLDPSWFKNIDIMSGDPFSGDYFGELSTTKAINLNYFEGMNITKFYKSEAKFTTDPFMNDMRDGKHGFVWAFGHGGGDGLSLEPGYITSKNIMDLPETNELPIFLSEACGNGAFDTRLIKTGFGTNSVFKYPTSFSESILLSKGGGIAYIGGARINYAGWNLYYDKGIPILKRVYFMNSILEYLMENYHNKTGALGDITRKALETYVQRDWFSVNAPLIKTFFGFTLQGDPTIKIPFFSGTNNRSIPHILPDDSKPMNMSNLPLYSIDDGSSIQVKSDSDSLHYILADYQNGSKPVKAYGDFAKTEDGSYNKDFHEFLKTKMAVRVIADDGKENRIVFLGRYNQDLVVKKPYDIKMLRNNEKKDYWIEVSNDGIEEASDVTIQVKDNEQILAEENFPSIPILSSRFVYYSIQSNVSGSHKILIQAPLLPRETYKADNQTTNEIFVAEKRSYRIGILNESPNVNRGYFESRLMLAEINKKMINAGLNMELCVVPFAWDEKGKSSLDRLDLDAIILYNNDFYTYPIRECMAELENFSNRGGTVFGFLCLGLNSAGVELTEAQSFFGISPEEKFPIYSKTDGVTKTFQLADSTDFYFPRLSYEITSRYTCLPKGKDWSSISMEDGQIIGISSDKQYALIKKDNRYLFTGFLADKDFIKEDQSLEFFFDLLNLVKTPKQDLKIENIQFNPPIGSKNHKSDMIITVRNMSNIDAPNIQVVLNREIKKIIPVIEAKGVNTIDFSLDWTGISGDKAYLVEINADKSFMEKDYSNNVQKGIYHVTENGEPDHAPQLEIVSKNKEVVTDTTYIISGKATTGSIIRMGQDLISQNEDGSFKKIAFLQPGLNRYTFTAQKGSLFSEAIEFEVTLQKFSQLQMKIGDAKAILDNQIRNLDSPSFISKGSTYVPLRFIGEIFKAGIEWNPKPNQEIKLIYGNKTIYVWIGKPIAKVTILNGETKEIKLSAPPVLIKGRAFVPLRFIAETFDSKVLWIPETQAIEIQIPIQINNPKVLSVNESEPLEKDGFIASANKTGLLLSPSCIDKNGDYFYVSMYDGIYKYDLDNKLITIIPWDPNFVTAITEKQLRSVSSLPYRGFFRISDTRIVISDNQNLYVLENPSGKFLQTISGVEYRNYAEPFVRFNNIQDIEILGDKVFTLDPYTGITIIDLTKGDLLAKYAIGNYPFDMTIHNSKLFICTLYGSIVSMNPDGSGMSEIGFNEDEMYLNSIAISDTDLFYVNSFSPENKVIRFTLGDSIQVKDQINLTYATGTLIEKMLFNGSQIRAITLNNKPNGNFALEVKYVLCDENMKLITDFGKEDLKNNAKKDDFICNPGDIAITETGEFIVSQNTPANFNIYRYYDSNGKWIRDLKLLLDDERAEFIDSVYSGNQTISVLFKLGGYFVQDFHFTTESKITSNKIKLQSKSRQLIPVAFARNLDKIAVADAFSGSIILFNQDTGLEYSRIYGEGNDHFCGITDYSKMIIKDDLIYILDNKQSIINTYALKDNLLENQYRILLSGVANQRNQFDFQILDSGKMAILDSELSKIYFVENGILSEILGDQMLVPSMDQSPSFRYAWWHPTAFAIRNNVLVVNDFGNQRIVFADYPREILSPPPSIQTSVEAIDHIAYDDSIIPIQIGFQIFNTTELYQLKFTDDKHLLSYYIPSNRDRSGYFEARLNPANLETGKSAKTSIRIEVGDLVKEISVQLERRVNRIQLLNGSSMITRMSGPFVSKNPISIEKKMLYLPLSTLSPLFNFKIAQQKSKFVLTCGSLMIECENNNSMALLITSQGKSSVDLGGKVKMINKEAYVPMNKIFELLGKKYSLSSTDAWVDF